MLKKLVCYVVMIVFPCATAFAGEIPTILLHDGENAISVVVTSNSITNLEQVTFSIDPEAIPSWLTVDVPSRAIAIVNGSPANDVPVLLCRVDNPPSNAVAVLPLLVSDAHHNEWQFDVPVAVESARPQETALYNNFPNPFNPSTTIGYSVGKAGNVNLVIYNSLGQVVRTLVDVHQSAGAHTVQWDGRNDFGRKVSSGIYLCTLKSGSFKQTKRMMMVE